MSDRYIVGIDPSTSCGFAVLRLDGTRVQSGTWDLKPRKGAGCGAKFVALHERLDGLLRTFPAITWVAYEVPGRFDTQAAYLSVYGLATHVESWCERNEIAYAAIAPAQVKCAAGLKGNAPKPELLAPALARFGHDMEFATDDEIDALWIAVAGLELLDG